MSVTRKNWWDRILTCDENQTVVAVAAVCRAGLAISDRPTAPAATVLYSKFLRAGLSASNSPLFLVYKKKDVRIPSLRCLSQVHCTRWASDRTVLYCLRYCHILVRPRIVLATKPATYTFKLQVHGICQNNDRLAAGKRCYNFSGPEGYVLLSM